MISSLLKNYNLFAAFLLLLMAFLIPLCSYACANSSNRTLNLIPIPEKVEMKEGRFYLTDTFRATIGVTSRHPTGTNRVEKALGRFLHRLTGRTGIFFTSPSIEVQPLPATLGLVISFKRTGDLKLHEDESYQLTISGNKGALSAETDIGILRGLETLLQLLDRDEKGYFFPAIIIQDRPRFPWRGLMIDSCRHFIPLEVIKRNLDGMAAVKLNVFHWHLSEDQGFRIECKHFPGLHKMGSDGFYYTQEQVREVIAYAGDRGIRVMPEFDIPGHSTSWLVAYPHLGSAPGPYQIERGYGVFDACFNPANKAVYSFFDSFFKEMAGLFPDEYMHIGGDEVNGKHWDANQGIQAFMKKHKLPDNHSLQAYFNKRILAILTKYKKKMVGWDEIFSDTLPKTIIIHSWRGKEAIEQAAKKGYESLLSNGYYIDLVQPAEFHYLNDPIPAASQLTEAEKKRILGGEATMWSELVTEETVDSRIWPRTAAIAERLWSGGDIVDVKDMYNRLDRVALQLEELGLTHWKNQEMMLRRLTGGGDTTALKVLVEVIEPLERYERHNQGLTYTFFSPLTRLVDAALPESRQARQFCENVEKYLTECSNGSYREQLLHDLLVWKENHERLKVVIAQSPVLKEIEPLSGNVSRLGALGLECIDLLEKGQKPGETWFENARLVIEAGKKRYGHVEVMILPGIEKLVGAVNEL